MDEQDNDDLARQRRPLKALIVFASLVNQMQSVNDLHTSRTYGEQVTFLHLKRTIKRIILEQRV